MKKSLPTLLLAAMFSAGSASAQTSLWNGGGGDTDWTTPLNWTTGFAPVPNDELFFGGTVQTTNNNNFTAGTQFNGITFVSGANPFVLGGSDIALGGNVVNQSASAQTIGLNLGLLQNTEFRAIGADVTVDGIVSGAFDLIKTGPNNLSLTNANTYTGNTVVKEGLLYLTETGEIDSGSSVVLGGVKTATTAARFSVDGVGGSTKVVNGVTAAAGRSILQSARSSGAGTFVLDAGLITQQTGSTLDFNVGASSDIAVSNANSNGILGGWAKIGSDWAAVDSGNVVAYTGYTPTSGTAENQVIDNDATSNVQINAGGSFVKSGVNVTYNNTLVTNIDTTGLAVGDAVNGGFAATTGSGSMRIVGGTYIVAIDSGAGTITLSEPVARYWSGSNGGTAAVGVDLTFHHASTLGNSLTDVNTIQFTDAANHVIDLGSDTLRLGASGGIWKTSTLGGNETMGASLILNGGTLTAGGAANTDGEIVFSADGPNDTFSSGNASRANKGIVINSDITDNGTGVVTATIDSIQTVEFNGDNSYSGGTYVNRGQLNATTATALGTGAVYISGDGLNTGEVVLSSSLTYNNDFHLAGTLKAGVQTVLTGDITLTGDAIISGGASANANNAARLEGEISGDYELALGLQGSSIVVAHSNVNWTGSTTITGAGSSGTTGALIRLDANQALGSGDLNLVLATSSTNPAVTVDLRGFDQSVDALTSTSNNGLLTKFYVQASTGTSTLSVGNGNGSGVFQGSIQDAGTGTMNLVKAGTGTQELSGVNTFSGTTAVNGGTLLLSGTLTGTSGVTANAGGTFAYTNAAALDRAVTVNSDGSFRYNSDAAYTGTLILAGGSVGGSGNLGATVLAGSGSVDPGNSPGIFAADSFDPSSGLGANFEFTLANTNPVWSDGAASGNDVLRLTNETTPFADSLDGSNTVGVYLGLASVTAGDAFTGGFYTDLDTNFLADVSGADFQYFVLGDGSGTHTYNGVDYYTLAEYNVGLSFTVNTVQIGTADFASGDVSDGWVTEFNVVPEPSTVLLFGLGLGGLLAVRRKRNA